MNGGPLEPKHVPVVRAIAPHVGETVDEEGSVEQPHVPDDHRVNADVPGLTPQINGQHRWQYEAQE